MDALIQCKNLCHSYGEKEVLHGLSFAVERGGIVGLLGKNGAGKSTTINILMGFLQAQKGSCSILGEPSHSIRPSVRAKIGLLHEGFTQYEFMSIEQIERFYAPFYPRWNRSLYFELVDRLGVPRNRRINRLSCGQRSQITLGLILAQCSEVMILDDYSMGLDVGYRRLFLEFLRDHVNEYNTTVLLTSHIVQELEGFLDKLIILQQGSIIAEGTKDSFMNSFNHYVLPRNGYTERLGKDMLISNVEQAAKTVSVYAFADTRAVQGHLREQGCEGEWLEGLTPTAMSLEDAFIGLTGRY